jgi:ketosteroid isomerase-like protein
MALPSNPTPRDVLQEFLDRIEDPDRRASAIDLFAPDAVVSRPATRQEGREAIADYLDGTTEGYEWVEKERERWIETDEHAISIGTLYGVAADGSSFEGIRYVDICTVEDGLITRLDIYNDSHAAGVL